MEFDGDRGEGLHTLAAGKTANAPGKVHHGDTEITENKQLRANAREDSSVFSVSPW
jgi:hypothetical protein